MLALALAPLHARFGVKTVTATTMQALSGAGYPGVASLDIVDNVVPFIENEEEKIENETVKILGNIKGEAVVAAPMVVSAQCDHVGHSVRAVACKCNDVVALQIALTIQRNKAKFAAVLALDG